jgi:hypothetical protein
MFFHQCQRPSFTAVQNHRQNYSFVYLPNYTASYSTTPQFAYYPHYEPTHISNTGLAEIYRGT